MRQLLWAGVSTPSTHARYREKAQRSAAVRPSAGGHSAHMHSAAYPSRAHEGTQHREAYSGYPGRRRCSHAGSASRAAAAVMCACALRVRGRRWCCEVLGVLSVLRGYCRVVWAHALPNLPAAVARIRTRTSRHDSRCVAACACLRVRARGVGRPERVRPRAHALARYPSGMPSGRRLGCAGSPLPAVQSAVAAAHVCPSKRRADVADGSGPV